MKKKHALFNFGHLKKHIRVILLDYPNSYLDKDALSKWLEIEYIELRLISKWFEAEHKNMKIQKESSLQILKETELTQEISIVHEEAKTIQAKEFRMRIVTYSILSIIFLFHINIVPSETGLWTAITSWPACILASCCCIKIYYDVEEGNRRLEERNKREKIKHDYENRSTLAKVGEFFGVIQHDRSTGKWNQTQGFKDFCAASERDRKFHKEFMRRQKERDEDNRRIEDRNMERMRALYRNRN